MVQTNKILTVSYGTFSCTLEGFDDAFGTMKAIAEYFRDLAADDRYFGAEPPQPDAEMLARIAQREIARRVDAHQDANGILLRATDAVDTPVPVAQLEAAPTVEPAPVPEAAAPTPEPVMETVSAPVIEDVPAADPAPMVEEAPVADAPQETPVDAAEAAPDESLIPDDWNDEVEVLEAEPAAPVMAPVADTMADKLARIRAVVERNEAQAEEAAPQEFDGDVTDAVAEVADQPKIEDVFDDAVETAEAEMIEEIVEEAIEETIDPDEDLLDAVQAAAELEIDEDENAFADDSAEAVAVAPIDTADEAADPAYDLSIALPSVSDRTVIAPPPAPSPAPLSEAEEEAADNLFGEVADAPQDAFEEDEADEASDDAAIQSILTDLGPEDTPKPKPIARVIKVKRSDLEDAITAGTLEEVADEPASSLSAEDEAELQAELAAVAAELAEAQAALNPPDETPEAPDVETAESEDEPALPARERGAGKIEASEPDLSRLMAEAASKMDEPESSSRREAYAHLRAAVAAAEAEESLGDSASRAEVDAAYREDLASVVRPRRPDTSGGTTRPRRRANARPAPLKLVAEQRIDADEILPQRGPIRPRRIAAEAETEDGADVSPEQTAGFAAFAKEVGAKDLHDLLEAAAAYLSFVEGREQFSRPQLMTRVKQVDERGFNREDGLRTFGQLLREGKIEKTSGGRFTASEQIGFRPARKAAG